MKTLYTAAITVEGGRTGKIQSDNDALNIGLSVPKEMGGKGGDGTNPEELFGAAYAACFGGAVQAVAAKMDVKIDEDFTVTANISFGKTEEGDFQLAAELDIYLPNITDVELGEKLVNEAHVICPFSRATRDNIDVTLNLLLDE